MQNKHPNKQKSLLGEGGITVLGVLLYPPKHKPVSSDGGGLAGKGGIDSTVCLLYPQKQKPVSFRVEDLLAKAALTVLGVYCTLKNTNLSPLGWRACW